MYSELYDRVKGKKILDKNIEHTKGRIPKLKYQPNQGINRSSHKSIYMKKFLTSLLLAGAIVVPMQADEISNHDNRLYFVVDNSADLKNVSISLCLENPTINITAIEMYLSLPEGVSIKSSQLGERVESTHEIVGGDVADRYFVSVASDEVDVFVGVDGVVFTLMCDFSGLQDGDYTISASGLFAVGVDGKTVTSYVADDQSELVTKSDDVLTGVDVVGIDATDGRLEIYNMQGIRLKEPQKGQINIINGKKVVL